ncbi:MAG: polyprenyl synthetase family protein [Lautropia sp.]|nr:polyprenyl synthetase family protein [Lautropia sp.]
MMKESLAGAVGETQAGVAGALSMQDWMRERAVHVEHALEAVLPPVSGQPAGMEPDRLHEAMRYAVLGGGKRVRPLLVYAAGELVQAPAAVLDGAACAVELIHAYSLVHDDMPAMDNDDMRRGRPTVHRQYDEATALLVGDALQTLAFEALVKPLVPAVAGTDAQASAARPGAGASPAQAQPAPAASTSAGMPVAMMVAALAHAAGSRGMAGGQALDIDGVGLRLSREQLERMHSLKTGAMLAVSVELGLLAGGQPEPALMQAMRRYGAIIGLAFQVVDDILDVTADSATLGKTAGKDQAQDKPTYVSMLGLEEARSLAMRLRDDAHACLQGLGEHAARLRALADYVVERVH